MTRREWAWLVGVSGLLLAASTAPYVAGYLAQTQDLRFGGALLDATDYHSYLAKMWQGYRGEWRYRLLFTPEEHTGTYLQLFYVALGHLARLTGLGLPLIYQIARVAFGFLMLLVIYRFIAHFVAPVRSRRVTFLLATTASGLGWLTEVFARTQPGGVSPIDFWLLDAFTYLSVLTFPHFCAASGLLLTVFLALLHRRKGPRLQEGALAVLASLALGLIHPHVLLLADLVPVLYWAVVWVRTRCLVWRGLTAVMAMGAAQIPLLAYDLWILRTQPIFAAWSAQNVTLSPPPRFYLWGYGMLLILAAIGGVAWGRRGGRGLAFPVIWVVVVGILIHLPWNLQRRFLEGVQVPLGLLAGVGLVQVVDRGLQAAKARWLAQAALVALAAISNLVLTGGLMVLAAGRVPNLFWPRDVVAGVDWLGENTSWGETALAGPETGGLIPARTGHRVVVGHGMETVHYEGKERAVARFFAAGTPDDERLAFLKEWKVAYVFHGPEERALGDFEPGAVPWLVPAFRAGDVAVYRVALEARG